MMTPEDLQDIEQWLRSEQASNRYLNERLHQSSGSELATVHVEKLLAEVKRLQGAVAEERERCATIAAYWGDVYNIGFCIAAAIRARANP